MKKRLIYFFVIFILILTILPNISLADAYGDFQYSDNGDGTCTITDYTGSGGDLVIPSTLNGLTVTDIANYAFIDNALSSVSLPNSIIYIGEYAFDQNEFTTFVLPTPSSAYFTEWICGASTFSGGDTVTAANQEPYVAQISGAAVTSITVTSINDTVVKTETLQMSAEVLPADADDKSVTWSVENGTGEATIDQTGLLTGTSYGTVTVKATANDGSNVTGEKNYYNCAFSWRRNREFALSHS